MSITERIISRIARRQPDFVIGGQERPYLRRWFVIPRNPIFNIYLHQFLRSDDDRALHDHPWLFNASILLRGQYLEWTPEVWDPTDHARDLLIKGGFKFRWGAAPHRVELLKVDIRPYGSAAQSEMPYWTLFITGPRVRQWGFHCPQGWVHWKDFTAADDKGAIGKGCDQ